MNNSFTIFASSSITNAVLAVFLELFIILLGQDVFHEVANFFCRRSLMKGRAVRVYGNLKRTYFVLCTLSILALCVLVELGIDGQINTNANMETRSIRPKPSVLLSHVSNWTEHEQLPKHPSELSLSDFPPLRKKGLECTEYGGKSPPFENPTDFFMFGDDECFDSSFFTDSNLISVRSSHHTIDRETLILQIGERINTNFSTKFRTLSFQEERAGGNETVIQLSISFRVTCSRHQYPMYTRNGMITFSVLLNWNYSSSPSNCSSMDSILFILHDYELRYGIICFTEVFRSTTVNDVTDLVPRRNISVSASPHRLETYPLRPENIFEPNEHVAVHDEQDVTLHKLYFALSKLHFVKENILTTEMDYLPYMVNEIDNQFSTQPIQTVQLRFYRPDGYLTLTVVKLFSVLCFSVTFLSLLVLKIVLTRSKRKAPFQVRILDAKYIASLQIYDEKTMQYCAEDSEPEYQVYIELDQDRGAVLRLRRKAVGIEDQWFPPQ